MFLLSKKFLGLLAATTLLLFGGGGFQATQGLRCWECHGCDPKTNPGQSVECTNGTPESYACIISVDTALNTITDPLKITISRYCCADCEGKEKGKCIEPQENSKSKFEYCYCNATDNCNKDQIAGTPAARKVVACSGNRAIIPIIITTIMLLCLFSLN